MTEKIELPYGADFNVAFAIVEIVNRENPIPVSNLFKQVNASNKPLKSYSKKMAEFIELISTNGQNVEITKLGQLFVANKTEQDKKKFLANNLPKKYLTLLGWIKQNKDKSMELNELKQSIIKTDMENKSNAKIYDWMLNTFANYGNFIGVLKYVKGQNSRCEITSLGEQALISTNEIPQEKISQEREEIKKKPNQIFYADVELGEGEYPIRILTRDGKPFDWEIHNEEDWKVVEAALEAIKRRWKNKNHNHIGPTAEKPTPNLSSEVSRDNSEVAH